MREYTPKKGILAHRLAYLREQRGISQSELAGVTGLAKSAISHYECGRRQPSLDNMIKLACALDTSIDYLVGHFTRPSSAGVRASKLLEAFSNMTRAKQQVTLDIVHVLAKEDV